ncbi:uncharacterized protein [Henckelia pumila]|uniref:uncharacterized protein n=1 Tax=Henckelia pumila TaxID=405737 RepID=UPI003C6E2071
MRRTEVRRKQEEDEICTEIPEHKMAENANLSLIQLGEDPNTHLMKFHVFCTSMKPHGVTEEQIQLRAFSFSLKSAAKDWLYYLSSGSITTWTEMKRIFLEKYFPASRAAKIRNEIYEIKQLTGESLHEYWERSMLDVASGGVFVDKTPVQARNLIKNMATNSQQFGTNRIDHAPKRNNEGMDKMQRHVKFVLQWDMLLKCVPHSKKNQLNRLVAQNSSSLPSQTVVNPKENVSAITLRSGRELKVHEEVVKEPVQNEDEEKSKVRETELNHKEAPRALKQPMKVEGIKGLYEIFCRCELNIPLLDVIKQVPRYAKFLKELCTVKRKHKMKGCQKVELGEQVSAVIQRKVPTKCKDSGPLNATEIVIQVADRSTIHPRGAL